MSRVDGRQSCRNLEAVRVLLGTDLLLCGSGGNSRCPAFAMNTYAYRTVSYGIRYHDSYLFHNCLFGPPPGSNRQYALMHRVSCLAQPALSLFRRKPLAQIRRLSYAPTTMAGRTYAVSQRLLLLLCIPQLTRVTGRRCCPQYIAE